MGKQIDIPFRPDMNEAVIWNRKFCTTRGKKYGEVDDWFEREMEWAGATIKKRFVLICVHKEKLRNVADRLFGAEGCSDPKDFETVWKEIHPVAGFVPAHRKWVHWFREVDWDEVD